MNLVVLVAGGGVELLQATPLLRTLRTAHGDAYITVACPPVAAGLAEHVPGVDAVVVLPSLAATATGPGGIVHAASALRARRLDVALVCSERARDRLVAYLAGIATRVGPVGGASAVLLTARVALPDGENRTGAWLRLASALGVPGRLHQPSFDPGAADRRRAESLLLGQGFEDGRLLVAVAPGMGYADRLPQVPRWAMAWEPERFAHLANQLAARHGAGVVVLGTPADRGAVDRMLIDLDAPTLDLCGELDLVGAAAVVERCDLLVGGDSPLLHLAAAVGTPAIGLFGPTDGALRGPYGPDHRVVQGVAADGDRIPRTGGGIGGPTMRRIRVDDVLAGIEAAF